MPSYNSEDFIAESIDSVLNQTYCNWELLITDDGSNDSTVNIIKSYQLRDKRIKLFISETNGGAAEARNNSIENSNGRFIAFLDSDDLWERSKLELQVSFMVKNNIAFSYTNFVGFSDSAKDKLFSCPDQVSYSELLCGNSIGCLTAVYDKEIVGKRLMPLIRKRQDMGLWLSILKDGFIAHRVGSQPLARYRMDSGMTKNKMKVIKYQWRLYREILKLPYFMSCKLFFKYAIHSILKHKFNGKHGDC